MQTNSILKADLLDILFEGRNKEYGAYELRKTYNRRLLTAVGAMMLVCVFFFVGSLIAGSKTDPPKLLVDDVSLVDLEPDIPEPVTPPPTPPPPPTQQNVAISQYTPPLIVSDDVVADEDQVKEISELENTQIGKLTVAGDDLAGYVAPPAEKGISGTPTIVKPKEDYDVLFHKVEVEAKFPGGPDAWKRYLERNLNAQAPSDEGVPVGRYTVTVQFIVDKEGNISNVQATNVPQACPSCGPEAVKVIKRGGKWEPAIQNGQKVIYQAVQHITFSVEGDL